MYMTKHPEHSTESARQAGAPLEVVKTSNDLTQPGQAQSHVDRGVWVPPGMTAAMVLAGAKVLLAEVDPRELDPYSARHLASDVFEAMCSAWETEKPGSL